MGLRVFEQISNSGSIGMKLMVFLIQCLGNEALHEGLGEIRAVS